MCLDFLKSLAQRRAPLTLQAAPEVNQLYVLRAAGLVQALFMRQRTPGGEGENGRFLAITDKGRRALSSGVLPEEAPPER